MIADSKPPSGKVLGGLALAALGVVYGDIGTSPLYALKECFNGVHAVPLTPENVLGVLSLVFWSLNFVVSFKYIAMVLRADNRGEGGILALLALVRPRGPSHHRREFLLMLGLFGAALLYGDGMITPAISVLAAVEGLAVHHGAGGALELAAPAFQHWVVPITIGILTALFYIQKRGTASVGRMFGPLMIVWFGCLAGLGIHGIIQHPGVVAALNPAHAWAYLHRNGFHSVFVLGAVFLVLTGAEALYADMGHVGRRPIRIAWWSVVLPALMLNYMGQGAVAPGAGPRGGHQSVLQRGAQLGALSDGDRRDRGRDDRVAGADFRRLLADTAGHAIGICSAHAPDPHLAHLHRPDLPARHQLDALAGDGCIGAGVQDVGCPGIDLRRGRHRHDADHHDSLCRGPVPDLALADLGRGEPYLRLPDRRPRLLRRQHGQVRRRRLVPARGRVGDLPADEHLAPRASAGHQHPHRDVAAARPLHSRHRQAQAAARARG